jgi:hypothetical protein
MSEAELKYCLQQRSKPTRLYSAEGLMQAEELGRHHRGESGRHLLSPCGDDALCPWWGSDM